MDKPPHHRFWRVRGAATYYDGIRYGCAHYDGTRTRYYVGTRTRCHHHGCPHAHPHPHPHAHPHAHHTPTHNYRIGRAQQTIAFQTILLCFSTIN